MGSAISNSSSGKAYGSSSFSPINTASNRSYGGGSTSSGPRDSNSASHEAYRREMEVCRKYEIEYKMRENHDAQFYQYSGDKEQALENLQLVLIIDHSGSMGAGDEDATGQKRNRGVVNSVNWTRYDNVIQSSKYLAESVLKYDADGEIPLIFFDSNVRQVIVRDTTTLVQEFERHLPNSSTNLLGALELAFQKHIKYGENVLFIVFTDGSPDEGQDVKVKKLIYEKLTKQDPMGTRLNIVFIRQGDHPSAINFLRDLDDCQEIKNNVDTKPDNAIYALGPKNLILNSIFEHLDAEFAQYI